MLDPQLLKFLQEHGLVADGLRALRPGGPLDQLGIISHCLSCGRQFRGSVRQFYLQDGQCVCGGRIDITALLALVRWTTTPGTSDAELPSDTFRIQPDADQDREGPRD